MSSRNPWLAFRRLLQGEGRYVATVQNNNGDGTSTVKTRDGTTLTVKGETVSASKKAMIENGQLAYEVPDLPTSTVQV